MVSFLKALCRYIGIRTRWLIGGCKKPFNYYLNNTSTIDFYIGLVFITMFAIAILGFPKIAEKKDHSRIIVNIQQKVDSATYFYSKAINDYNNGMPREKIAEKYSVLGLLKSQVSAEFDSLNILYQANEISKNEYDNTRRKLMLDSVQYYQEEANKLGLVFR